MKTQMRFQKILMLVSLVVAALTFVFALFFLTGSLGYATKYGGADSINAENLVEVSQGFVDTLVVLAIVLIVLAAVLYITSCNSRRNYYITNYIAIGLFVAFSLAVSIYIIISVSQMLSLFLNEINWEIVPEKVVALMGQYPIDRGDLYPFILGYVVAAIVVIDAAVLVLNAVWKHLLMKGEKELLARSADLHAEEVA